MKNTSIPDELLAEVQKVALAEHSTADAVVQEAIERHLRLKRREKLYAYGEGQAAKLGIKESDVTRLVQETRSDRGR